MKSEKALFPSLVILSFEPCFNS